MKVYKAELIGGESLLFLACSAAEAWEHVRSLGLTAVEVDSIPSEKWT